MNRILYIQIVKSGKEEIPSKENFGIFITNSLAKFHKVTIASVIYRYGLYLRNQ